MVERTEILTICISEEEKNFLLKKANSVCLSIEDYIMLLAISANPIKEKNNAASRGEQIPSSRQ